MFGVISDIASGIITRKRRTGFKRRKGNVEAFSGERGSNGEREMLRHFLENGVHNGDRELSSGDWGSNGERGSLFGSKSDMKLSGFKCGDQESSARKKSSGVQEKQKNNNNPPADAAFRPWLFLCYHFFWYPG